MLTKKSRGFPSSCGQPVSIADRDNAISVLHGWSHPPCDIPDKAYQLTRNSCAYLVVMDSTSLQFTESMTESYLRLPRRIDDFFWLTNLAWLQSLPQSSRKSIVPGSFNENAPHISIAGFGDRPAALLCTARML